MIQNTDTDPKTKIIALIGSTSSGKSELAVKLAKKFNGEIINADSRQIYQKMDLGTGKVKGKWLLTNIKNNLVLPKYDGRRKKVMYFYKNIRHYCIDFVNPKNNYSAALFKKDALISILDIISRNKLPILTGGTGHWIDAVVYDQAIPDVKPNPKLRAELNKLTTEELYARIAVKDPTTAKRIDKKNRQRLIRALEIILVTGKPVPKILKNKSKILNPLWLGINIPQTRLYKKIDFRLKQRLKQGLIKEVKKLHQQGISWKKLDNFGLEYRFVSQYLKGKLSYKEMSTHLSFAIKHYSKRQLTWWKRNKDINWIKPSLKNAANLVKKFLGYV